MDSSSSFQPSAVALAVIAATVGLPGCPGRPGAPADQRPPAIESFFPLAALDDRALCDQLLARQPGSHAVFVDPATERRRKVIVSDLHLGPGRHAGPRFAGIEDFFFEAEWAAFLRDQSQRAPTDLIIAGDFIEFWQILGALKRLPERNSDLQPGAGPLLASDQDSALEALEYALVAHAGVFRAIGHFLNSGDHRVILLPGNHDAELLWPRAQLAVARAVAARDPARLVFVDAAAYQHGGVHIEHGHRHDGANQFDTAHAPFGRDSAGRCRLQASWGEIFVAHFFNDTERELPFIDNLYPESAAILWGVRDDPDAARDVVAVARFLDMVISAQSRRFNLSALSGALRGIVGLPADGSSGANAGGLSTGDEIMEHLADRLLGASSNSYDIVLNALMQLQRDPRLRELMSALVSAARELPDLSKAMRALSKVEPEALETLRGLLFGDPMTTAARRILAKSPEVSVVVFGHTHTPGGSTTAIEVDGRTVHYANSGAWIPVTEVRDLKDRGVTWSQLSLRDRRLFAVKFPAVIVNYSEGGRHGTGAARSGPQSPNSASSNPPLPHPPSIMRIEASSSWPARVP